MMKNVWFILFSLLFFLPGKTEAQLVINDLPGNLRRCVVENGDTIIIARMRTVVCYPKKIFKSKKEENLYWRDVRDVKKTLPLAKLIHGIMLETYEYIETLPTEKERDKHLKKMQSELFDTYKPTLKKLTFRQGKLLVKLIDRECKSNSYTLIQAYLGSFAAGFWQGFGKLFGVSLKAHWDPTGKDQEMEKICVMVEYGMI
ncbi:MAG: DUF4294 domain-containing protein [Bacteroidales bacterium]